MIRPAAAKPSSAPGGASIYDAFSQDFFIGQLPFNTSNAGPAYNGIGAAPVLFATSVAPVLAPGVPVFSGFAATDVFTVDPACVRPTSKTTI